MSIKTRLENPNGLHGRYYIQKIIKVANPYFNELSHSSLYGKRVNTTDEFILKLADTDEDSEYFILRLDTGAGDIEHLKACRIAVNAYADAIQDHLPQLAEELKERYPLI